MFADVLIPKVPVSPFTYKVPERLIPWVEPGMRVRVPVKEKDYNGFIIALSAEADRARLKNIDSIMEPVPVLPGYLMDLAKWISEYYICGLPETYQTAFPRKLYDLPEAQADLTSHEIGGVISVNELTETVIYDSEIQTIKESVYNGVFPLKYKRYKDIRVEYLSEHEQVSYNQPYSPN
ncbi:MAG: hypothetical protein GF307_10270, partial [candidate division Zixibacteria bacterium]|nr:hypothetical protein [candidate division Zixibacteria bacterium]